MHRLNLRRISLLQSVTIAATAALGLGLASVQVQAESAKIPVASSQLVTPGKLTYCTNFPAPPQEMYTKAGKPEGSDIDTGNAIAKLFGLKPIYRNLPFDTIIEALQTHKCDLIITGIFITPPRSKQINFVPYFAAGQQLLARKGNPEHLAPNYKSLCGKTIATQIGDAELATAQQFSKDCTSNGLAAIKILSSEAVDTALQQVTTNHADAFFYDSPLIAYYVHQQPSEFQAAGPAILGVLEGIGVTKAHGPLKDAVVKAMRDLEASGAYRKILSKWGLGSTKVPKP